VGVLNLGYPLWLLLSVLVVFALLLYYVLRGRVSEGLRVALAVVLAPVCTVGVVAVAVVLSALLYPLYETPTDPVSPKPLTSPAPTPDATSLETTGPTASPSASPSAPATASPGASATASPGASATASPVASPSVSATASASPAP
jgi:hypothetical protein